MLSVWQNKISSSSPFWCLFSSSSLVTLPFAQQFSFPPFDLQWVTFTEWPSVVTHQVRHTTCPSHFFFVSILPRPSVFLVLHVFQYFFTGNWAITAYLHITLHIITRSSYRPHYTSRRPSVRSWYRHDRRRAAAWSTMVSWLSMWTPRSSTDDESLTRVDDRDRLVVW